MSRHFSFRRSLGAIIGAAGIAACSTDKLLNLNTPDVVTPGSVASAAGAEALRAGAVQLLASAVAGGSSNGIGISSGLASDEFGAPNNRAGMLIIEQRLNDENNDQGYAGISWSALQRSRQGAATAIRALKQYLPTPTTKTGQMYSFQAYSELVLAENYCSGIPFSDIDGTATVYGTPLTTVQALNVALAHFDTALSLSKDSVRYASLARVGRARTLLQLGRYADAGSAVGGADTVLTEFVYNYEFSNSNSAIQNGMFTWTSGSKINPILDGKGTTGIRYRSAADPRLPIVNSGVGQDGTSIIYGTSKFGSLGAPLVMADGIEARLIQAEAKLNAGDAAGSLAMLNALRTRVAGLTPLTDAGSADARLDQLFRERAFWMFGTAHRLADLRRLVRTYGRPTESVFPTGVYKPGQVFGPQVNLAIPIAERANPNFNGCLDRKA
jgi:starch-binding outer membrane protein, SusD/RagB family